jgi:anaerobic selenocysteine-containing dehydrogenase
MSPDPTGRTSRRSFLKTSAAAAAFAATGSIALPRSRADVARMGRGSQMPGTILMIRDPAMNGHAAPPPMHLDYESTFVRTTLRTSSWPPARSFAK